MIDEILRWGMLGLLGAMMVSGLLSLYLRPGGTAWRCPGAAPGWRVVRPSRYWFLRGRCWHRLDGLPVDSDLAVRCPECGTRITRKTRLRAGYRFRFGSLALTFLVLSIASGLTAGIRGGGWSRSLPSLPLVMLAQADFITHRSTLRRDLAARNEGGHLGDVSKSILAWRLVRDFRDDDRSWNSIRASDQMRFIGTPAIEALRWEFLNGDDQSKSESMRWLRSFDRNPPREMIEIGRQGILSGDARSRERFMHYLGTFEDEPSEHLIDLWLQSCADHEYSTYSPTMHYLMRHLEKARLKMMETMRTGTGQQKFILALTFAERRDPEALPLAVEILSSHLEDNDIMNDQKEAVNCLSAIGPLVHPLLDPYMETLDLQGRYSLGLIKRLIQRYETATWEEWYRLSEEDVERYGWWPWFTLDEIENTPQYILDQIRLETNDASR